MIRFIFWLICLLSIGTMVQGQKSIEVGGMKVHWEYGDNTITFTANAPDDGWVALGFNREDNIVGSNLIMVGVNGQRVTSKEFYVVGMGNPKPIEELGSSSQILKVNGKEKNGRTSVTLTLPTSFRDKYHYDLRKGAKVWLICAYSMEDDFDHHSRMRKHVEVTL